MVASISGNKESGLENRSQIKKFTIDTCQFRFHLSCSDWPRAVQRDRARERRLQGLCVENINARGRQSCYRRYVGMLPKYFADTTHSS
jgi:hypothetical protein